MKLISARWTPRINLLQIACVCGEIIEHPSNRWSVYCPHCKRRAHLGDIRAAYLADYLREQGGKDANHNCRR